MLYFGLNNKRKQGEQYHNSILEVHHHHRSKTFVENMKFTSKANKYKVGDDAMMLSAGCYDTTLLGYDEEANGQPGPADATVPLSDFI